jgi:hypothetical protein
MVAADIETNLARTTESSSSSPWRSNAATWEERRQARLPQVPPKVAQILRSATSTASS